MDVNRESLLFVLLAQKPVYFLDVLVLTGVGGAENCTDKDGVLIN